MSRASALALASLLCAVTTASCGGGAPATDGAAHAARGAPIELTLRGPDGEWLDVGDLRGAPTVLFLFSTFDVNCQAAVLPLSRVARDHPEAHFVAVAIQPDARELIGPYKDALHIAFTVTYDADGTILGDHSDLGHVESVPTYVVLDARGRIASRYVGVASERRLETMIADAAR